LLCHLAEESQGIRIRLAFANSLCRQGRAVGQDWVRAAPVVDSGPRDLGEAMNSENYSPISPRTVGGSRRIDLEFLRF